MTNMNRRKFLIANALGMGSLALRSIATGLPVSFLAGLANPAMASTDTAAKFLILSHRQSGDPTNIYTPGTYADDINDSNDPFNQIERATVSETGAIASGFETPVSFNLGNETVKAAQPWSTLSEDLRNRFAFWHHSTLVAAHTEFQTVRTLNGALKADDGINKEELSSFIAQTNASRLSTLLDAPICIGSTAVKARGETLPIISPSTMADLFDSSIGNIDQMVRLRDSYVDRVYREVRDNGTHAQKTFLDRYAISRADAKQLGDNLGSLITDVDSDSDIDQAKVAVALMQLNITPVVVMGLDFGGDNHNDISLSEEVNGTTNSMASLNALWDRLKDANMQDNVVFASLNPFGRTLARVSSGGRNHHGMHHTMFTFGSSIKAGVVGGIELDNDANGTEFKATAINSATGESATNGDVTFEQSLASVGKTLAKAVGVSDDIISTRIDTGKVITGALVS